jgi:hypothetical protein
MDINRTDSSILASIKDERSIGLNILERIEGLGLLAVGSQEVPSRESNVVGACDQLG